MKYKQLINEEITVLEEEILRFWEDENIFDRSIDSGKKPFIFYEGPPSANGLPGVHHVMARTIKDIFCRYKTLQGFRVERKSGWDTHGLPVELKVEKDLHITKEDIGKKISVAQYNSTCRSAVMEFKKEWEKLTKRMGYWIDMKDPYVTFHNNYIETIWYLLKQLYDKKLLYKGYTVQPYSPMAGTGLSSHELNLPGCYRQVKDTSITAQFKVIRDEISDFLFEDTDTDVFFLAWTTTPWTLPSNCALAIGEKISYVKIKTYNQYTYQPITVILAEQTLPNFFSLQDELLPFDEYKPEQKKIPFKKLHTFLGKQLLNINYEQLMPYVRPKGKAFVLIAGDFVTTEEGTGIVHTASIFGVDDFRVCQQNNISSILVEENGEKLPLVDKKGRFRKEVTDFPLYYLKKEYDIEKKEKEEKSTDVLIAIKLKRENRAFKVEKYEHAYPHCWRTGKPILYYPLDSWFIKTTACKEKMIELNKKTKWYPHHTGEGRFADWLKNLVDWNLSRSRFWGTPLPIWRSVDQKETICIGSFKELQKEVKKTVKAGFMPADGEVTENGALKKNIDIHKPYIDAVILLSDSGKPMYREKDVIDVWFDSGAMPFAQWHYPFENKEQFEKNFPADFISEGVDQTRGWFFTLHAIASMIEGKAAFKNVISTGLVLDKQGRKMSKSIGNTVDPVVILKEYGADVLRWYMVQNAPPWENIKFDEEGLKEVKRKFFGTLFNTYSFFIVYANLDNFTFKEKPISYIERSESDRWIISRLHSLIDLVEEGYKNYNPTQACRGIRNFVIDDLSNWYVRLNRKRFWKADYKKDKIAAYQTLYECLIKVLKMASCIAPFSCEAMYRNLNQVTKQENYPSVHLSRFPKIDKDLIDESLETKIKTAQKIVSMVHSLRKLKKIKVRQPLSRILIPKINDEQVERIQSVEVMICEEVNIKKIEFIDDNNTIIKKTIKPNFKKLGTQYGAELKEIMLVIKQLSAEQIAFFEKNNYLELSISGKKISFDSEDLQILPVDIPGWTLAREHELTVALDLTITDNLRKEGIAREFVNKLQNLRKENKYRVEDKIHLRYFSETAFVNESIESYKKYICTEIQALTLQKIQQNHPQKVLLDNYQVDVWLQVAEQ